MTKITATPSAATAPRQPFLSPEHAALLAVFWQNTRRIGGNARRAMVDQARKFGTFMHTMGLPFMQRQTIRGLHHTGRFVHFAARTTLVAGRYDRVGGTGNIIPNIPWLRTAAKYTHVSTLGAGMAGFTAVAYLMSGAGSDLDARLQQPINICSANATAALEKHAGKFDELTTLTGARVYAPDSVRTAVTDACYDQVEYERVPELFKRLDAARGALGHGKKMDLSGAIDAFARQPAAPQDVVLTVSNGTLPAVQEWITAENLRLASARAAHEARVAERERIRLHLAEMKRTSPARRAAAIRRQRAIIAAHQHPHRTGPELPCTPITGDASAQNPKCGS